MKPGLKKSYLPLVVFLGAAVFLLLVILALGNAGVWIPRIFRTLFHYFASFYRSKIAYLIAFILVGGLIVLPVKRMINRFNLKEPFQQVWGSLKSVGQRNKIIIPLVCGFFVLLSVWFFYIFSFFFAFAFASAVMICFSIASRQDKKKRLILAVVIVLLSWAPYLVRGPNIHVKIFDNLDCHIPHTKVLAESGKAFSLNPNTKLDNFINGLPLSGVDSGFNVLTWLFMIFPPFTAYALNDLLVRLVALLGMVLLLKKYIIKPEREEHHWIIFGAAACFALLPFYPDGGISIAGIPLLLYSFLNIRDHEGKFTDFLIIFIFPFYSKLVLSGFFIAIALFILFIIDCLKKKRINLPYLGGLALLTLTYCFTHFHILYSFLSPGFISYREEISTVGVSTAKALKYTIDNFIFDRVNVVGAQHMFVMGAAALAIGVSIIKKVNARLMKGLIVIALSTSFLWGFKYWTGIIPLREKFQILNEFDFSRFYWFNPFLWYLIFALALLIILKIKYGKIIAFTFIICQLLFMFMNYNWEIRYLLGIKTSFAGAPLTYSLTYKEFYSEALFAEIHQYINKPKRDYRVISLGIPPGVSQYNGFYTLDIYTYIYPLEYKNQFRKIIEKEVAKNARIKRVFDENARKCYLFVSDLDGVSGVAGLISSRGKTDKESQRLKVTNMELNTAVLKEMGGEYILAAVEVVNYRENNLKFEKVFKSSESPWTIYLYRVL
ncbi:MAG: hypothetical protein JSV88_24235 [Candidatus Aminicenantes bacterium]|nr:MAG: hypothetical protein JSV88_24235 [Candidatus Aminicenantes bacterium]